MTRTKNTYLALLAVLLSPMAANAVPIPVTLDIIAPGTLGDGWAQISSLGAVPFFSILWGGEHSVSIGFDDGSMAIFILVAPLSSLVIPYSNIFPVFTEFVPLDGSLGELIALSGGILCSGTNESMSVYSDNAEGSLLGPVILTAGPTCNVPFDPFRFFYTFETGEQISIDVASLPTSVPEPGTLALFGIGLAGIGLTRRRRKV